MFKNNLSSVEVDSDCVVLLHTFPHTFSTDSATHFDFVSIKLQMYSEEVQNWDNGKEVESVKKKKKFNI